MEKVTSSSGSQEPVHILLLLDGSGSINKDDWAIMRQSSVTLLERLSESTTSVSIVVFSSGVSVLCEKKSPSGCKASVAAAQQPNSGTNTGGAIATSRQLLQHSGKRIILLFTDGYPNDEKYAKTEADLARAQGIEFFGLGFGRGIGKDTLDNVCGVDRWVLAEKTGVIFDIIQGFTNPIDYVVSASAWVDPKLIVQASNAEFSISLKLFNPGKHVVQKGAELTFKEARREGSAHDYFDILPATTTADILPEKEISVPVRFRTTGAQIGDSLRNVPKNILYELTFQNKQKFAGRFELSPGIFIGTVLKTLKDFEADAKALKSLNALMFGPAGHGKSFTASLMVHVLRANRGPADTLQKYFFFCEGEESHCTETVEAQDAVALQSFLERESIIPLRITDIMGVDHENYKDEDYLHALVEGRVKSGTGGTKYDSKVGTCVDADKTTNVIILVAKADSTAYKEDMIAVKKMVTKLSKSRGGLPAVLAVTHMGQVATANWAQTLEEVSGLLGVQKSHTFPIATYDDKEVAFETEMQVLELIQGAAKAALTYSKKKQTWLKGDLCKNKVPPAREDL